MSEEKREIKLSIPLDQNTREIVAAILGATAATLYSAGHNFDEAKQQAIVLYCDFFTMFDDCIEAEK